MSKREKQTTYMRTYRRENPTRERAMHRARSRALTELSNRHRTEYTALYRRELVKAQRELGLLGVAHG